ncbi:MAG: Uncharacterised protein [Hyphomonas sp. TMED17]|nr:MAG: Uncharacterised protein [Hyphomonas sp. TMED17]
MSSSMIEFLLLAAIAIFIGWRLYITLGQDAGPPEGRVRGPVVKPDVSGDEDKTTIETAQTAPDIDLPADVLAGLKAIDTADRSFELTGFLTGARGAYEFIVTAFAEGDLDRLRPLLDDDVFEAWEAAISARDATDQDGGPQLLRLVNSEIREASVDQDRVARIAMLFEADLNDGVRTFSVSEVWTFKRSVNSKDPNWLLDDVDTNG